MQVFSNKTFGKNVSIAIIAQLISLAVSFLLNLIVPKYITIDQYSSWQAFSLYISYVGILHFGLLDGLMLRYSQYDYDELDKSRLRTQFLSLIVIISFFSLIGSCVSIMLSDGLAHKILLLVSIGIVTKNLFTFNSYTFQLTNRIGRYAALTIIHRLLMGGMIICLILLKVQNFVWYCCAELFADLIGFLISSRWNKGLYFGKMLKIREILKELRLNVSAGIKLLIANWASMFILGSARMLIQWHWNLITFGKVSFAFSLTNLFLSFITTISIVFFPSIKRLNAASLPKVYIRTRRLLDVFLFSALLLYFPISYIMGLWLPQYTESLDYLGILLPMIVFSSKVMLLTNNYLKAYRKEGLMLRINMISMLLAVLGFAVSAFVLDNLYALLLWVLVSVMIRSIISESLVSDIIKADFRYEYLVEVLMAIAFVLSSMTQNLLQGFLLYSAALLCYLCFQWKAKKNKHLCD